jgi:hypothetical protein
VEALVAALVLQCLGGQDGPAGFGERRLDNRARPQPPGQYDVELGGIHVIPTLSEIQASSTSTVANAP